MRAGDLLVRDLMSPSVVGIEPDATVAQALATMGQHAIHELPVLEGQRLRGWVSYDEIIRRTSLSNGAKVRSVMTTPARIAPEEDAVSAAARMVETQARALPVVDPKDKILGIISRTDLMTAIGRFPEVAKTPLEKIMTRELETVGEDDDVENAAHRLRSLHLKQLLVIDETGKLVGYLGVEEVARTRMSESRRSVSTGHVGGAVASGAGTEKSRHLSVGGLARPAPHLPPTALVEDAVRRMEEADTTFVALADDEGLPLGIVTRLNILQRIAALRPTEGVLVQISGLKERADPSLYDAIYAKAHTTLKKVSDEFTIEFLSLHFKFYKAKQEGDEKISLTVHLGTDRQLLIAKADGWHLLEVADQAFDVLEHRSREAKELRLERRKGGPRRAVAFYS